MHYYMGNQKIQAKEVDILWWNEKGFVYLFGYITFCCYC